MEPNLKVENGKSQGTVPLQNTDIEATFRLGEKIAKRGLRTSQLSFSYR
jgi:hypothetical protein